ncbi:MAG: photosynthetic reaction center cytochrome c subunit [Ignavibacteriales bacterium]|nr:photosynthetic reaction center cytochrome c subunit [Ignavibacteriales bacterium]
MRLSRVLLSFFIVPVPVSAQTAQQPERNKHLIALEEVIKGKESSPAEQVFKNIEIFKGQQAGRVLRVMEFAFTPGLGVECNFCHVEGKWESDENDHKVKARAMWKMLPEVNKLVKGVAGDKAAVNCYTCHRGEETPALTPRGPGKQ